MPDKKKKRNQIKKVRDRDPSQKMALFFFKWINYIYLKVN